MEYQSTIAQPATISGKGLHSGQQVNLHFKPATANHGIIFKRTDLPGSPLIHALVKNVYDTSRGTSLKENEAVVKTVEHLMAALAALCIDNLLIEIDGEEIPIMDGSAKEFIRIFKEAGTAQQDTERAYIAPDKEIRFSKEESGIELTITPADDFKMTVYVDYGTRVLADQQATLTDMKNFETEMSDSRTFVFLHELQFLIAHNLVKGGDMDNAVVFVDKIPDQKVLDELGRFFNKKDIEVTEYGTLNHNPLHHLNEPARHKLLDLVGDLYLLGKPLKGHIVARKPGHFANTEFGKLIAKEQ